MSGVRSDANERYVGLRFTFEEHARFRLEAAKRDLSLSKLAYTIIAQDLGFPLREKAQCGSSGGSARTTLSK
jgi:hypothetical protein